MSDKLPMNMYDIYDNIEVSKQAKEVAEPLVGMIFNSILASAAHSVSSFMSYYMEYDSSFIDYLHSPKEKGL